MEREFTEGERVAWIEHWTKLVQHGVATMCKDSCTYKTYDGIVLLHVIPFLERGNEYVNPKYMTMVDVRRLVNPDEHPQTYDYNQLNGMTPQQAMDLCEATGFDSQSQRIVDEVAAFGMPRARKE